MHAAIVRDQNQQCKMKYACLPRANPVYLFGAMVLGRSAVPRLFAAGKRVRISSSKPPSTGIMHGGGYITMPSSIFPEKEGCTEMARSRAAVVISMQNVQAASSYMDRVLLRVHWPRGIKIVFVAILYVDSWKCYFE
jgi:hypothetical protein